jgi:site-specific DNA-methyltransferase (adenine-specific)
MSTIAYNMDCMEAMRAMPDKCFDLAIVDPPYGIGVGKMSYLQENKTTVLQKNGSRIKPRKTLYKKSTWDSSPPDIEYFKELIRISKEQIIWGINHFKIDALIGVGRIKWDKRVHESLSFNRYEYAYCSMIDYEITYEFLYSGFNVGIGHLQPTTAQRNTKLISQRIHPTQKPVKLYEWLLKNYAKQGDRILDTHLGSGSSRIAADKMGFEFVGYELDADYFQAQEKRFAEYKSQLTLDL